MMRWNRAWVAVVAAACLLPGAAAVATQGRSARIRVRETLTTDNVRTEESGLANVVAELLDDHFVRGLLQLRGHPLSPASVRRRPGHPRPEVALRLEELHGACARERRGYALDRRRTGCLVGRPGVPQTAPAPEGQCAASGQRPRGGSASHAAPTSARQCDHRPCR